MPRKAVLCIVIGLYIHMNVLKKTIYHVIGKHIPIIRIMKETQDTQTPVRFGMWFLQKVMGFNRSPYWPVHFMETERMRFVSWRIACATSAAAAEGP